MYKQHSQAANFEADNQAGLLIHHAQKIEKIELPKNIWMYWQGNLPALVARCIAVIQEKHPDYHVYVLNDDNIAEFCDEEYYNFQGITSQQRADLIRLNLLYKFGGIWLDASIILLRDLNWIGSLMQEANAEFFSYYRDNNTTIKQYPILENWLMASVQGNSFIKAWLDELIRVNQQGVKNYLTELKHSYPKPNDLFQNIGNIEYLFAYVACQKVMREHHLNYVVIDCDENALMHQVKNRWVKEKILIDFAINYRAESFPYLIKLAKKERNYLLKYYDQKKFLKGTYLDF